ncbi:MAG: metallophosphoesterase family protein [Pseudomonadota bacterium]
MNDHIVSQTGRVFVFGGSYGNLQATSALLERAESLGFGSGEIIFTGDTVAYCGQPAQTVELIRNSGIHVIMGNCEEALGADADDCGCGFEEGSECSLLSVEWYRFCRSVLDSEAKSWMRGLHRSATVRIGEFRLQCTHATPASINQFVFPSDIATRKYQIPDAPDLDGYITGHSGLPFVAEQNNKIWINSGAAGMPANDGTPRVWYATLEADTEGLVCQTCALDYDHQSAAISMTQAGLANGYRDCLHSGIWPSHDVLPEDEKSITGQSIRSERRIFRKATLPEVA